jgi:pimeloyl-ACP methyl ester carboxylesterase
MIQKLSEQAILLGKQQSLVGILTRAVAAEPSSKPTVVILNTGVIHRVGHNRMFVSMSRTLAGAGYTVLRFDFSGIGDSAPRTDGLSPLDSSLADITDVLDWLEKERQISRVILVGLCSGADHAVLHGHTDPRVVALVLMDPSIPATARYYLHYIAQRLTRLHNWISVMAGRSGIIRLWAEQLRHVLRPSWKSRPVTLQDLRFHNYLEHSYKSTVDHGIQILAVFTEDSTRQTYREQMIDAFPNVSFGNQLKLEFFPGSDHTFSLEKDRARLIDLVLNWLTSTSYHGSRHESPAD